MENIYGNDSVLPLLSKGQLYKLTYVPRILDQSDDLEYLKDQSIKNFAVTDKGYILFKNMDSCHIVNETFFCDPSNMIKVTNSADSCITRLYENNCSLTRDCYKTNGEFCLERSSKDEVFKRKNIDDNEILHIMNTAKPTGTPIWVFMVSIIVILLIVFLILFTWVWICVRRCKSRKSFSQSIQFQPNKV